MTITRQITEIGGASRCNHALVRKIAQLVKFIRHSTHYSKYIMLSPAKIINLLFMVRDLNHAFQREPRAAVSALRNKIILKILSVVSDLSRFYFVIVLQ